MTNFDYLKTEPRFDTFSDVAISAEKIIPIDSNAGILMCRRAKEFAVKWMYSVGESSFGFFCISFTMYKFHDIIIS